METDLGRYLERQGYLQSDTPTAQRWEFVHGRQTGSTGWQGPAKPMYRLLRNDWWIEWSEHNPDLAPHLWERVVQQLDGNVDSSLPALKYWAVQCMTYEAMTFDGSVDQFVTKLEGIERQVTQTRLEWNRDQAQAPE